MPDPPAAIRMLRHGASATRHQLMGPARKDHVHIHANLTPHLRIQSPALHIPPSLFIPRTPPRTSTIVSFNRCTSSCTCLVRARIENAICCELVERDLCRAERCERDWVSETVVLEAEAMVRVSVLTVF